MSTKGQLVIGIIFFSLFLLIAVPIVLIVTVLGIVIFLVLMGWWVIPAGLLIIVVGTVIAGIVSGMIRLKRLARRWENA